MVCMTPTASEAQRCAPMRAAPWAGEPLSALRAPDTRYCSPRRGKGASRHRAVR